MSNYTDMEKNTVDSSNQLTKAKWLNFIICRVRGKE